jgi:hypothetical protein
MENIHALNHCHLLGVFPQNLHSLAIIRRFPTLETYTKPAFGTIFSLSSNHFRQVSTMSKLGSVSKTSLEEAQQFLLGHSSSSEKANNCSSQKKKRFQWRAVIPWFLSLILLLSLLVQEQRHRSAANFRDSYWKPHELG